MGKNLVFMPECHSTNTFALELCQQKSAPVEGTVVITANQSAGRGQRGNAWHAEPGKNLTLSAILRPTFLQVGDQFYLNIFASLAIVDYLKNRECSAVRIKWPNDIFLGDQKICGILIENHIQGKLISHTVVGIGLNINQRMFSIETATSLSLKTDRNFELSDELETLLHYLESRYLQLRQMDYNTLMAAYISQLYWFNEEKTFEAPLLGRFRGKISGLDPAGQLKITIDDQERSFGIKDVSYVKE